MSRTTKRLYTGIFIALFLFFVYLFADHLPGGEHPIIVQQPLVAMPTMYMGQTFEQQKIEFTTSGGVISFPLSLLQEKKIVEFDYHNGSLDIPLIAFINGEGRLVTGIRYCEPCNSKSFRIEGTELACGKCETRWKLNNLEGLQGACQKYPPALIQSEVVDNRVQFSEEVVKQWKIRI